MRNQRGTSTVYLTMKTFAAALLCALLAGCTAPQSVTLPATSAASPTVVPPEVVLDAYLRALQAGDCSTARALTMPTFVIGNGELCGVLHVSAFTPLTGPATPKDGEVVFSTDLTTSGGDISMPDGDHIWFYTLDRQPSGAWRISGGGSGP